MLSESAYQSTPYRFGPYTVITRLDTDTSRVPVPEERFIARSPDGAHTVLVCVPQQGADTGRFLAEAESSRYLVGPWLSPAAQVSGPGETAWHARPYLPALPLPTALAVHGGPLPEHAVRALGASLAEALAVTHGQGLTHAGISPAAVLLSWDGPRLGCFGAVRAAAPDGESRSGLPGLESGSLPPEQATGGRPRPPGDIFALGATLAYAATGHTVPERRELPATLREIVTACLSRDPASRPRATEVLQALAAPVGEAASGSGATAASAAGWLPGRVMAAIALQSAEILAAEITATESAPPVPPAGTGPAGPAPYPTPPPAPPAAPLMATHRPE